MFVASISHEIDKLELLLQTKTEILPSKLKAANQQNFVRADNASEVTKAPASQEVCHSRNNRFLSMPSIQCDPRHQKI